MITARKALISAALVGSTLIGGALGAALIGSANAQETTTTIPASPTDPNGGPPAGGPRDHGSFDPRKGGHVGPNGVKEELLTGDTAEKVKAAALASVPGGTVERVETDAEGSPYEAHMTKADGSHVTVKVDNDFKVSSVEDGHR